MTDIVSSVTRIDVTAVLPLQEEEEYETKGGRRRTWDDDFVLKRQFSALVPAFDPRPGRTNVQQTTDLEIPPPGNVRARTHKLFVDFDWFIFSVFTFKFECLSPH